VEINILHVISRIFPKILQFLGWFYLYFKENSFSYYFKIVAFFFWMFYRTGQQRTPLSQKPTAFVTLVRVCMEGQDGLVTHHTHGICICLSFFCGMDRQPRLLKALPGHNTVLPI